MELILCQGAEATIIRKDAFVYKSRIAKSYRIPQIDDTLRLSRTRKEKKALLKAKELGVPVPTLYESPDKYTLVMDYIDGKRLRDVAITKNQQILDYFKGATVYKFNGTASELQQLQEETNNGYNFVRVQDVIYFVAQQEVRDSRAVVLTGE